MNTHPRLVPDTDDQLLERKSNLRESLAGAPTESAWGLSRRKWPRRFFMKALAAGGAFLPVGAALADRGDRGHGPGSITRSDAAILRFLAAAEILETDLWQQYTELAGVQDAEVPGGTGNPAFTEALKVLDEDMDVYIHDNTENEMTHELFLNAYLTAHGAAPANLDAFRTLPSS